MRNYLVSYTYQYIDAHGLLRNGDTFTTYKDRNDAQARQHAVTHARQDAGADCMNVTVSSVSRWTRSGWVAID